MKTLTASPDNEQRTEFESGIMPAELAFYEQYPWSLNAFPTMADVAMHLREELSRPEFGDEDWRHGEVAANLFLLSCAISDTVDDFLSGPAYDFSQAARVFAPSSVIVGPLNRLFRGAADLRIASQRGLLRWRSDWENAVIQLNAWLAADDRRKPISESQKSRILALLAYPFPSRLLTTRIRIPAAFRSQDLTHFDGLELGRILANDCPDRNQPILIAGLRTAGSYFAPLVRGYLEAQHYRDVATITLRPKQGLSARERARLAQAAAKGALAAIVDEPVYSAGTLAKAVECVRLAGFAVDQIRALFPAHPFRREWRNGTPALALSGLRALTLEPEDWHKSTYLESPAAIGQIRQYLESAGMRVLNLRLCPVRSDAMSELSQAEDPGFHWRLKRVYEVEVENATGAVEKGFVLAKSAGWGWLGYHSFLAGTRLAPFVPRVLGLRHGVLFMDWQPQDGGCDRRPPVEPAGAYIASRARLLKLPEDPARDLAHAGRHRGTDELAAVLSGAYGWKLTAALKRPRVSKQIAQLANPLPTLIDGKMRKAEWIGRDALLKTDFEHHGMGKHELNVTDPAYDLAEMILHWDLSSVQEHQLIEHYAEQSGDAGVSGRLILHKLLAGTWAMSQAIRKLNHPTMWDHRGEINREYLQAWRFLTAQTTRFCAGLCRRPENPCWSEPLMVLDVDGVLDKQIFGFPSTTAAGIEAVSLLASHGIACALNTARSVSNLKEYCRAYGFVGGAAEYGSFAWDATTGRERVLVSPESLAQMKYLRSGLSETPGVFFDDDFQFIVRAYTYAHGRTVPVPEMLMRGLISRLQLDRLRLHQTYTDTAVIATECNKGLGLSTLLDLAGHSIGTTVAVGDSEPDLAMFHQASRSFAPAQIGCPDSARLLGCRIAGRPYQAGLLEIVRGLVHPAGGSCDRCRIAPVALDPPGELLRRLLQTADRPAAGSLLRALLDPQAVRAFLN